VWCSVFACCWGGSEAVGYRENSELLQVDGARLRVHWQEFDSTRGYPGEGPETGDQLTALGCDASPRQPQRRRLFGKQPPEQKGISSLRGSSQAVIGNGVSQQALTHPPSQVGSPIPPRGTSQRDADEAVGGDPHGATIKISIFEAVNDAKFWLRVARERAARRGAIQRGFEIYFANISSWSAKATSYLEYSVQTDCLAVVETHLRGPHFVQGKNKTARWGYRTSGREALPTGKSRLGTSGGCMLGISRAYASYSLGPANRLEHYATSASARYWCGRFLRMAGRDILLLTAYLPPGRGTCPGTARHDAGPGLSHTAHSRLLDYRWRL
jgi:hypothetical protein